MTIDEMVAALERELRVTEPEPIGAIDPLDGWPVHKLAAWVYHGAGADWLTAMLKHADLRYEVLVDNAAELERRHFPHIAAILRKAAKDAPSQVDDCIERDDAYRRKYGPAQGLKDRGYWYVARFLQGRERITGQSRDELVAFYGLEEWLGIADNGAERMH